MRICGGDSSALNISQVKKGGSSAMGKGQRTKNATANATTFTAKKEEKKGKLKGVLIGAAIAVVLLILVGLTVFNMSQDQGWFEGNEVVMNTENYSVNQGMFSYFFNQSFMNVYNTYYNIFGDNISSYIDRTKSLKEQAYGSDGQTWYDYILEQTKTTVQEYLALCEGARAEGVSIGNEERSEINSELNSIKDGAKTAGYSSAGDYIRAAFGKGVSEGKIKKALEIKHLAVKYAQVIADRVDVSDEVLEAKYNEDPDKYDKVSYLLYTFNSSDLLPKPETAEEGEEAEEAAEPTEEEVAAAKESIRTSAGELAAVTTEEAFKEYVKNYALTVLGKDEDAAASAADSVLKSDAAYSETDAMKWAFAAKAGETNVIEGSDGATQAVYFLVTEKHRDDNDGYRATRHVLFGAKTEENAEQPDGAEYGYDDPAAIAKEVYDKWVSEGATEDGIAALAKEYTTDSSSKDGGGLYENVTKGQFVEPFNTWLFDEARKEGDYDLIETEYGWHIVYFISKGEPQWKNTISSELKNAEYDSFKEEAAEKYPVTVNEELIEVDA